MLYTMRRIPHAFPIFFFVLEDGDKFLIIRSNVINPLNRRAASQLGSLYSIAVLLLVESVWSLPTIRRATCDQAWM